MENFLTGAVALGVGLSMGKKMVKGLREDFPGSRCFGDEECKAEKRSSGECVYDGLEPRRKMRGGFRL